MTFISRTSGPSPPRAPKATFRFWLTALLRLIRPRSPRGSPARCEDLRNGPGGPEFESLPFESLYLLEDEWAAEVANRTMHGVMHIGWVPDGDGGWRGQMAVLVKPNGPFGSAYMAAIRPFRHLFVYPPLMRRLGQEWRRRMATA